MSAVQDLSRTPTRKFDLSFPKGGQLPETEDIGIANWTAVRFGRMNSEPQRPEAVGVCCSQIDINRIHGVQQLGWIFKNAVRGGRLSPEGIASLTYPYVALGKPVPPFMEVLVHSCTEEGICRSKLLDPIENDDPALQRIAHQRVGAIEGVKNLETAAREEVPFLDRLHARTRALKILTHSPTIRSLVASGDLIVGEAYYAGEASTHEKGKVHWLGFWTSSAPGKEIPIGLIEAITRGKMERSDLIGLHPGLSSLNALVLGNRAFTSQYEMAVPTEVVAFGCADSRVGSLIMKSPHGLVEWMHNAGNVVDSRTLLSLRVSLEGAVRNLTADYEKNGAKRGDPSHYKRRAVCLVMSHSRCGAAAATLDHLCTGTDAHAHGDAGVTAPLIHALSPRFSEYVSKGLYSADKAQHFTAAAEANAVGACREILTSADENALLIQEMVRNDKVLIVPSYYLLTSGVIQMLPPLPLSANKGWRPGRNGMLHSDREKIAAHDRLL